MSNPVKIFRSTDTGAPTLTNVAGKLLSVLDAVLIDGYNAQTLASLTRSGGTATAYKVSHGFSTGDIVLVAGATQSDYNGEAYATVIDADHLSFPVANAPVTPATGTITIKKAPAGGWVKPFTGTNRAAYKSVANGASSLLLYVDDTTTTYATVSGFESMLSIDMRYGAFKPYPNPSSLAGTDSYWTKSSSSTPAPWQIIADARMMYVICNSEPANGYPECVLFGDFIPLVPTDGFNCILSARMSVQTGNAGLYNAGTFWVGAPDSRYTQAKAIARSYSKFPGKIEAMFNYPAWINRLTYPNEADAGIHFRGPIDIIEGYNQWTPMRGSMPGVYWCLNSPTNMTHGDVVTAVVNGVTKRVFIAKQFSGQSSVNGQLSAIGFDLDGPWR